MNKSSRRVRLTLDVPIRLQYAIHHQAQEERCQVNTLVCEILLESERLKGKLRRFSRLPPNAPPCRLGRTLYLRTLADEPEVPPEETLPVEVLERLPDDAVPEWVPQGTSTPSEKFSEGQQGQSDLTVGPDAMVESQSVSEPAAQEHPAETLPEHDPFSVE